MSDLIAGRVGGRPTRRWAVWSLIEYYLGRKCSGFTASVGVDDEVTGSNGSVVFQVFADETKVAYSGTVTGSSAARSLSAVVSDAYVLRLVVTDPGDGIDYDHANHGSPELTCA